jgi:hypothetical protein
VSEIKIRNSIILAIIASIGITIVLIYSTVGQENPSLPELVNPPEINTLYDQIEETKKQNDQSDNPYIPTDPKWDNAAGPIVIDNDEYILGQKVFVNISGIDVNDKGRVNVYMPVRDAEYMFLYSSIGFDGSQTRNNYYFTPQLSPMREICNADQLVGEWTMKIEGTQYPDLTFTVIKEYMPGFERNYETITNVGKC